MIKFKQTRPIKKTLMWLSFLGTVFASNVYAAQTIGSLASNVTKSIGALTQLVTAGAYVGGTAMFLIAIFQFRQHKENPSQVPLSKPMMFLAIAGALLFLPSLIKVTGQTIFGGQQVIGSASGSLPSK